MSHSGWTLLGDLEPRRKLRDLLWVVIPLVLADLLTKLLALWLLAGHPVQFLGGGLRLELVINERLFGSRQTPGQLGITTAMLFGAAIMMGLTSAAGLQIGRADWTIARKLLFLGLVLFVGTGSGLLLGSFLPREPHRLAVHAARAFGSLMFLFLALRLTRSTKRRVEPGI